MRGGSTTTRSTDFGIERTQLSADTGAISTLPQSLARALRAANRAATRSDSTAITRRIAARERQREQPDAGVEIDRELAASAAAHLALQVADQSGVRLEERARVVLEGPLADAPLHRAARQRLDRRRHGDHASRPRSRGRGAAARPRRARSPKPVTVASSSGSRIGQTRIGTSVWLPRSK